MPIIVPCPKCGTKLSAPDSAVGKQVRCPKSGCATITTVPAPIPAEEVEVVDAALATPEVSGTDADDEVRESGKRSRRNRRRQDDDEPPRKKQRRVGFDDDYLSPRPMNRKAGLGTGVIVAVVCGVLIVLGIVGYGIYAIANRNTLSGSDYVWKGPRTPPPPGWQQYTFAQDHFRAYLPLEPHVFRGLQQPNWTLAERSNDFSSHFSSGAQYHCGASHTSLVAIQVYQLKPGVRLKGNWDDGFPPDGSLPMDMGEFRAITWFGTKAYQLTSKREASRYVMTDVGFFVVSISSRTATRTTPEEENGFFDNFELVK